MSQHSVLTQIRHTDAEKARENLTRPDATTRARTSRIQRPMECWPSQLPCSHGVYCERKGMADGQEDVVADGMCFRFAQLSWRARTNKAFLLSRRFRPSEGWVQAG